MKSKNLSLYVCIRAHDLLFIYDQQWKAFQFPLRIHILVPQREAIYYCHKDECITLSVDFSLFEFENSDTQSFSFNMWIRFCTSGHIHIVFYFSELALKSFLTDVGFILNRVVYGLFWLGFRLII